MATECGARLATPLSHAFASTCDKVGWMRYVLLALVLVGCGNVKEPGQDAPGSSDAMGDGSVSDTPMVDTMIDAMGTHVFDVAYPKEWKFSVEGPISGYFLIVNTSATPINSNTLELKSIDDDHPTAIVRVTVNPGTTQITQARASGSLSGLSQQLLVGSGLVTETRVDTTHDYLTLEIQNIPTANVDIAVALEISISGIRIAMPMTIHVVDKLPTVYADPMIGERKQVFQAP
jgi:hypothetical protein